MCWMTRSLAGMARDRMCDGRPWQDAVGSRRMLIRHPASVAILALEGDAAVVVVQTRPGAPERTVELPAGCLEPGETELEAAVRELREECSLAAARWRSLGGFWAAPAYSTEWVTVFEAVELRPEPGQLDADE